MGVFLKSSILVGLLGLMLGSPLGFGQALPDFTVLVEQNAPAIVNVSTSRQQSERSQDEERTLEELLRYFYGDRAPSPPGLRGRERSAVGSGFIIDGSGVIITNHHVVEGADEVKITLNDQREFMAEIIGSDERSDLAVLKIEAEGLPSVRMGESHDLKVGEWVLAIGSPFGLSYSVSAGIVSYIGRSLPSEGGNYVSFIQTDVPINPGHSGGPLFNLRGEVVGINSQIFTNSGGSIGLSFAIPVDVANNVVAQLRDKGFVSRGWLGVGYQDVTQEMAREAGLETPRGARVNQVLEGGPAEQAGLREGDIILEFNQRQIRASGDLPYYVGLTAPGVEVPLSLLREGNSVTLNLVIGELEETSVASTRGSDGADNVIGLVLAEVESSRLDELELDNGVVVVRVTGRVAREAGFRSGDILISLDGEALSSQQDYLELVSALPQGRPLPALIWRGGRQTFLTLNIP